MALTQRLIRLFRADLHEVLDRLEEPEILLRQALREMEEELAHAEKTLKQLSRNAEMISRRQQEITQSRARAEQELELCFQADNETLARTLLKRKLEMEKLSRHIASEYEELQAASREQRSQLAQNRDHYESVRQKAELLAQEGQRNAAREVGDTGWPAVDFCVRDEEVDIALLKEKQRRAMVGRESA